MGFCFWAPNPSILKSFEDANFEQEQSEGSMFWPAPASGPLVSSGQPAYFLSTHKAQDKQQW
jgi:hypothetical protein